MAKVIHSMIRVLDLEKSVDFYQKALGLKEDRRIDFDDFTLVYLRNAEADFELELTLNKGRTEPYTHGSGYGHIAVCVDDVDQEYARIKQLDTSPTQLTDITEMSNNGEIMAKFFFMKDPDGYEIEVLQRSGSYQ